MNTVIQPKHNTGMAVGHFAYAGQPMSADEVMERYRRKGLCVTCGRVQTHVRSKFGLHMEPITRKGECYQGHCLKCHTMTDILEQLTEQGGQKKANGLGPPVVYGTERYGNAASAACGAGRKREWLLGDETGYNGRASATSNHSASASACSNTTMQTAPSTETASTVDTCGSLRNISSILAGMKANPENPEVQRAGCADLCKHAACTSPAASSLHHKRQKREEILEAVEVVVAGMKRHLSDIDVQKRGCHALFRFTSNMTSGSPSSHSSTDSYDANGNLAIDADLCRNVVSRGGVSAVVSAMETHLDSRSVQREAMRVLRNALRATSNHSSHARNGRAAPSREAQIRVLHPREVKAIINAMERYAEVLTVQRIATDTLKIAAMSQHNWEVLRDEENVERLKAALRETARNFQKECESSVWAVLKVIRVPGSSSRNQGGGRGGARVNQEQAPRQAKGRVQAQGKPQAKAPTQGKPQAKVQTQAQGNAEKKPQDARACPKTQVSDLSEVDSLTEEVESRVKVSDGKKSKKGKKSKRWKFL